MPRTDGLIHTIERDAAFPVVLIVNKLPKTMLGRYFECARPRRLELSLPLLAYPEDIQKLVSLHEVGHWFRGEHLPIEAMVYGKSKSEREEEFAHDFTDYFFQPRVLKERRPYEYDRFKLWLTPERQDRILGFAREALGKLQNKGAEVGDHTIQRYYQQHLKSGGKAMAGLHDIRI